MARKRVLIIGLDGATWDIYKPVFARGHMPRLAGVLREGTHGVLRSTEPPITPTAWTTFMTGVGPGKHKVFGFEKYDRASETVQVTTSRDCQAETMWSHLSRLGYRVASLNMPWTYPPYEVNGLMVSGYGCPATAYEYTWPAEFKGEIERELDSYDMVLHWRKGDMSSDALFEENMAYCRGCFDKMLELAELARRKGEFDVFCVEIQQVDLMQHYILHYLTPEGWQERPDRAEQVFGMLDHMDEVIGKLLDMADEDTLVMIASDHGFGSLVGKVKPNNLLRDWGYLTQQSAVKYMMTRLKRNIRRYMTPRKKRRRKPRGLGDRLILDWSRTRAFAAMANHHAYLYVNLAGRDPHGIVQPGEEYERLLEELKEKFLAVQDPQNGRKMYSGVYRPEELYGVKVEECELLPDLLAVTGEAYLNARAIRGQDVLEYAKNPYGGCHRPAGLYALRGPGVKTGYETAFDIADIVPTLYAFLGAGLPAELDGKVMQGAFEQPLAVSEESAEASRQEKAGREVVSQDEQDLIQQRLADLGYLE